MEKEAKHRFTSLRLCAIILGTSTTTVAAIFYYVLFSQYSTTFLGAFDRSFLPNVYSGRFDVNGSIGHGQSHVYSGRFDVNGSVDHDQSHDVSHSLHITHNRDVIRILYWKIKQFPLNNKCALPEHMRCEHKMTMNDPLQSDAIVFKAREIKRDEYPIHRRPDQKWLFFDREAPVNYPRDYSGNKFVFNSSVTFARDSHVPYYYGYCTEEPTKGHDPSFDHTTGKTKLVAWMASNCRAKSKRQDYVSELQKHVEVDVYGRCGSHKCPRKKLKSVLERNDSDQCEETLQQYKFYLAFENSFCRDYVTEKLWRTYTLGMVPVVYGGADYKSMLAPNSYINVEDFKSPQHLAEHLKLVGSNDTLYNEYFQWKKTHRCQEYVKSDLPCDICEYLHRTRQQKSRLNVYEFWDTDKNCFTADQFRRKCDCWPAK